MSKPLLQKPLPPNANSVAVCVLALCTLCVLTLSSCATTQQQAPQSDAPPAKSATGASYIPERFDWQPICAGADYAVHEARNPSVRYHCVKINLNAATIAITAYPASKADFIAGAEEASHTFIGKRTADFAKESGATIALNGAPFSGNASSVFSLLTSKRKTIGTHILQQQELGNPTSRYGALVLQQHEHGFYASIIDQQTEALLTNATFAFGGFWTILRNDETLSFAAIRTARTACGIADNGTTLYLLAVEGKRKSVGLSYAECAAIFKALHCDCAMEFDGGGSTELCINGKSVISYRVTRKNGVSWGFTFKDNIFIDH